MNTFCQSGEKLNTLQVGTSKNDKKPEDGLEDLSDIDFHDNKTEKENKPGYPAKVSKYYFKYLYCKDKQ